MTTRILSVEEHRDGKLRLVGSKLRLKGAWLRRWGFQPGDRVMITVATGDAPTLILQKWAAAELQSLRKQAAWS